MSNAKYIEVAGTHRERGFQHGKELKGEVHEFYGNWLKAALAIKNPPTEDEIIAYSKLLLPDSAEYAPELIEELEGIAEGAGISFDRLFSINCFDEICCYGLDNLPAKFRGCTVFGATGTATVGGKTYIGQGWDISRWYVPIFCRSKPSETGERETVFITHPGMLGGPGMNDAGIAFVWSSLNATDKRPSGVPAIFIGRRILQKTTLSEGLDVILNTKRAHGFNMMVASPEAAVDVQTTAEKQFSTYVQDVFGIANHYEAPFLLPYEGGYTHTIVDTIVRSGRMRQLLEKHKEKIDLNVCKEMLCDHVNYPCSICRHETLHSMADTVSALIFAPGEGLMLASKGPPCDNGFEEYRIGVKPVRK